MNAERPERPRIQAPLGELERSLIAEFVRARGYDSGGLTELPEQQREALLKQASVYASARMAEIESRAHFVHEIHDAREETTHRGPEERSRRSS